MAIFWLLAVGLIGLTLLCDAKVTWVWLMGLVYTNISAWSLIAVSGMALGRQAAALVH